MLNLNKFCSLFIGLILSVVCALPLSARDINVRGTVTNIEGEPLFRVSIYNAGTNKLIGSTNEDGKYLVKIDSEGELLFTSLGYEEHKAAVRGELTVDVVLRHSAVALEEVVVSAKRITDNVVPEPTDIEVKGNKPIQFLSVIPVGEIQIALVHSECKVHIALRIPQLHLRLR